MRFSLRATSIVLITAGALGLTSNESATQASVTPLECTQSFADPAPTGATLHDPSTIKLVNWNIQKGSGDGWLTDMLRLILPADLVVLQEASPTLPLLKDNSGQFHRSFAEGYTTQDLRTGVMTLSRAMPLSQCRFLNYEPWLGTPKATLVTRYGLIGTKTTLLVINMHGVNFSLGMAELQAQLREAEFVINRHNGPVILAGDFNTWHLWRIELLNELKKTLGLNAIEFADDQRTQFFGYPLDHVLTRGLTIRSAQTLMLTSSDHNPLIVELQVSSGLIDSKKN